MTLTSQAASCVPQRANLLFAPVHPSELPLPLLHTPTPAAFRDFLTELETNMATWHDQAQKIRQVVQTRMNTPTGTTAPVRRLLTTDPGAKLDAAKALLSKVTKARTVEYVHLHCCGCWDVPSMGVPLQLGDRREALGGTHD